MGPSLRTFELANWARSRGLSAADEQQLRAVFEERDRLNEALEDLLVDVDLTANWTGAAPMSAQAARRLLEETAP